jgi:hypothetical protein
MRTTFTSLSMAGLLFVVGVCVSEVRGQHAPPTNNASAQARGSSVSADALRGEVRAALQASMRVSRINRADIVERLVDLHNRLAGPSELPERDRERLQTNVRNRLQQLSGIIQRQDARELEMRGEAPRPATVQLPRGPGQVLAQRLFGPPAGGFAPGRPIVRGAGIVPLRPAAAQPFDYGPALVNLIQRTIEPASWDVNGGPGAIVYFAPSRALVVRNRSEVHEQLQDVVRQLRP